MFTANKKLAAVYVSLSLVVLIRLMPAVKKIAPIIPVAIILFMFLTPLPPFIKMIAA